MCRVSGDAVTIAGAVTATFARVPVLLFASSPSSPSGSSSGPDGSANPRFDSCPGTEPTHWQPQSLFVVFVPLPPVSEMRLPRPWPPVFRGPHDDLHDGHREQDDRREQHKLQHVRHRLGMDRVATLAED